MRIFVCFIFPFEIFLVEIVHATTASLDAARPSSSKEKKVLLDPNNDQARHWLTYPNPKTPQYLIDIRQRLGQLKVPSAPIRPATALDDTVQRSVSSPTHRLQQKSADGRHMFDFSLPQTPDELRASRHRLEKHRYNPALDNYPQRPKTCPVRSQDIPKPATPPDASQSQEEKLPTTETQPQSVNEDLPVGENKPTEHEASTLSIQMIDIDGLPTEYAEAVQTANIAEEEYLKTIQNNQEKRSDQYVYRLPSMPLETQNESAVSVMLFFTVIY